MRNLISDFPYRIVDKKSDILWKGKNKEEAEKVFEVYVRTGEVPKEGESPKTMDGESIPDPSNKFPGILMDGWNIWKINGQISQ